MRKQLKELINLQLFFLQNLALPHKIIEARWGDLLTSVNGQTITYDANGNPLSYYNGENYTFTWQNGRRLASAVKDDTNVTYTYDSEGLRIEHKRDISPPSWERPMSLFHHDTFCRSNLSKVSFSFPFLHIIGQPENIISGNVIKLT